MTVFPYLLALFVTSPYFVSKAQILFRIWIVSFYTLYHMLISILLVLQAEYQNKHDPNVKHTEFVQITGKLVMAVKPTDDKTKESSASSTGTVITFTESATGATK
jgi:hypothetical protein